MVKRGGYVVVDADTRHREYPDTFGLPDGRGDLQPGDLAKLVFEFPNGKSVPAPPEFRGKNCGCCKVGLGDRTSGERMWVEVTRRGRLNGKTVYFGKLMNYPVILVGRLSWGDKIRFGPEHVCGVGSKEDA